MLRDPSWDLYNPRFHLETEPVSFYQEIKKHDDHLWIDVTSLMQKNATDRGELFGKLGANPVLVARAGACAGRAS